MIRKEIVSALENEGIQCFLYESLPQLLGLFLRELPLDVQVGYTHRIDELSVDQSNLPGEPNR